jgi:type I restriction enzyme S subunit
MSIKLRPYPAYKDSGLPWLGEIPAHWQVRPGLTALRQRQMKNDGMVETTVLSLSYGRIIVKPVEKLHGLVPASFDGYQVVEPGDVIIRPTDLQNDHTSLRVGIARDRGIITSAYLCLRSTNQLIPEFGYLLLHAYDVMKVFYGMGSGLRQNLDFTDLKRMPVVIPPREEQDAIAAFLAHADRRINRLIRAKRRLIELLNEEKQAIIHRAVTRGLDPNVPLKPSGIDWLGDVPEHWEVAALRRFWDVVDCKHLTVPFVQEGIPLASVTEVQSFNLDLSRCKRTTAEWYQHLINAGRKPQLGDLIYCRNASVGACAYVDTDVDFAMGQDVCLIRSAGQNQRYLNHLLHSRFMAEQLERLLVGSTFKRINISKILSLSVLVPPRREQDAICAELDEKIAEATLASKRAATEIDLLREYRIRLIADVVTGKLDVLGVELPPLDEDETLDSLDIDELADALADDAPASAGDLEAAAEAGDADAYN